MDEKIIIDVPAPMLVTSSMDIDKKKMKKKALTFPWLSVKSFKKNKPRMPLLSVQEVLWWALLAAGCVAVAVVVTAGIAAAVVFANAVPCSETPSWRMIQCPTLTPAQSVEVESFAEGYLWFTVPQAAAAAAGLLLPRRRARSRWALAFVALISAAAAAHYMQCRTVLIFIAANPEDTFFRILGGGGAVVFVAGDLISILSLLIGGTD